MKELKGVRRLIKYLKKRKGQLIVILCISMISSVADLIPAQIVGKIVDILPTAKVNDVFLAITVFGIIYLFSAVLQNFYGRIVMNFNNNIIEDVRKDLFLSTINKSVSMSDEDISGDVITRATSDIEQITRVVAGPLNGFLRYALMFIMALILIGIISIPLAMVTVFVSVILYFLSKDVSIKNKENGADERKYVGVMSKKLADVLRNKVLINSYGTEKQEVGDLNQCSNNVFGCRKRLISYMTKYWCCVNFCNAAGYVLAFLIMVQEISSGKCSVGQVIVIYSYLQTIFSSMINVSRYRTDIYNADAALLRVFVLIQGKDLRKKEDIPDEDICKIRVEGLSVGYNDKVVADNVSFELEKGKLVVLAGGSGKGKSSIIYSMLGFVDILNGKIFFDKMDVTANAGVRRKFLRASFQKAYLFHKSIKENVQYGEEKDNWCYLFNRIGIDRMIENKGDEDLDSTNNSLSGGEQRRLSLYRTVNRKVPCYIFDEPTAELDMVNKQQVIESLVSLKENAIVLVVTHDEELMKAADTIITIN